MCCEKPVASVTSKSRVVLCLIHWASPPHHNRRAELLTAVPKSERLQEGKQHLTRPQNSRGDWGFILLLFRHGALVVYLMKHAAEFEESVSGVSGISGNCRKRELLLSRVVLPTTHTESASPAAARCRRRCREFAETPLRTTITRLSSADQVSERARTRQCLLKVARKACIFRR